MFDTVIKGIIMLWVIRARMRPALSVVEMIPDVHRTPALAALRKAALDGKCATLRLSPQERELAFYDAPVPLLSPIGARLLLALYREGRIKLKKPARAKLPGLEAYIATEAAFRAEVAQLIAEEDAKRVRLAQIITDPACARLDEITPYLIDKVMTAKLGHNTFGSVMIGGVECHKSPAAAAQNAQTRAEAQMLCWWLDAAGARCGDVAQG